MESKAQAPKEVIYVPRAARKTHPATTTACGFILIIGRITATGASRDPSRSSSDSFLAIPHGEEFRKFLMRGNTKSTPAQARDLDSQVISVAQGKCPRKSVHIVAAKERASTATETCFVSPSAGEPGNRSVQRSFSAAPWPGLCENACA